MLTKVLKYKYVLAIAAMLVWVYFIPLKFGGIEELGQANSNQYFSHNPGGRPKLFSVSTVKHNNYLDEGASTILTIDSFIEIPPAFIQCLLNEEDKTFFTNPLGINLRGLGRAMLGGSGGGSGICQQTVKNIFFASDESNTSNIKNWNRKLAEVLLTINFAENYSRREILKAYLNNIFVARDNNDLGTIYGLKLAALYHFNKSLDSLSFSESALLAKYINKPNINFNKNSLQRIAAIPGRAARKFETDYLNGNIDSVDYRQEVLKFRREKVLNNLLKAQKISEEEFAKYNAEPFRIHDNFKRLFEDAGITTERGFVNLARKEKDAILDSLHIGSKAGLKIYTTLDLNMQEAMQRTYAAINKTWKATRVKLKIDGKDTVINDNLQCAVFCMDKKTGAVMGLLDGRVDFNKNWNNYCFTNRQAGSIFKIFDYYTLFFHHPEMDFNSLVPDKKTGNFSYPRSHSKNKDVSIRDAISYSTNIVPYNLVYGHLISLNQVAAIAEFFRVKINNPNQIATVIGQDEVNLSQMVNAYNTVSNEGVKNDNFYILKIENRSGKILYQRPPILVTKPPVLDPNACVQLKHCFNGVINPGGTAAIISQNKFIDSSNINFGGKTGTTDNASNIWYIGYTPEFTMGIWQGYPKTNAQKAGNAGKDCAIIWSKIITKYNGK